jgi:hypothetical protein
LNYIKEVPISGLPVRLGDLARNRSRYHPSNSLGRCVRGTWRQALRSSCLGEQLFLHLTGSCIFPGCASKHCRCMQSTLKRSMLTMLRCPRRSMRSLAFCLSSSWFSPECVRLRRLQNLGTIVPLITKSAKVFTCRHCFSRAMRRAMAAGLSCGGASS